jgi:hypothetical protein
LARKQAEAAGFVTLRRFYVGANVKLGGCPEEIVFCLSPHYATPEEASAELPAARAEYPKAGIVSAVVCFDPSDPADMERYGRMLAECGPTEGKLQ